MKRSLITAFVCLVTLYSTAQNGYEIPVTLKPFKNQKIYMGTYQGKSTILVDSAIVNQQSEGTFKGSKKLIPGIYLMVSPSRTLLFDFLVGDDQQFSIAWDTASPGETVFKGSIDNEINQSYSKFMTAKLKEE